MMNIMKMIMMMLGRIIMMIYNNINDDNGLDNGHLAKINERTSTFEYTILIKRKKRMSYPLVLSEL